MVSKKKKVSRYSFSTMGSVQTDETLPLGIKFIIETIENVDRDFYNIPFSAKASLKFNNNEIGVSDSFSVQTESITEINSEITYGIPEINLEVMNQLISFPFVFTVTKDFKKNIDDGKAMTRSSFRKDDKPVPQENPMIGCGNMDILPLLLGKEAVIQLSIGLEAPVLEAVEMRVYSEIPRLNVKAESINYTFTDHAPQLCNIMYFTLESMYNFENQDSYTRIPEITLAAATVLPISPLDTDPNDRQYEILEFGTPTEENFPDFDMRKCWTNEIGLEGRSKFTNYRLVEDNADVKNPLGIDIGEIRQKSMRLQWNTLKRTWLSSENEELVYNYICKYRCWPIEFELQKESAATKVEKGKSHTKQKTNSGYNKGETFVTFLDVSNLLHPGITKTIVASQVWTWSKKYCKNNWDLPFSIFSNHVRSIPTEQTGNDSIPKVKSPRGKEKPKKIQKDAKEPRIQIAEKQSVDDIPVNQFEIFEIEAVPLYSDDGKPVFILAEIELLNPLVQKLPRETIINNAVQEIPPRLLPPEGETLKKAAVSDYRACIRSLCNLVTNRYEEFKQTSSKSASDEWGDSYSLAEESSFFNFVSQTGLHQTIKETLRDKIITYIRENVGGPLETNHHSMQMYFSSLYVTLVEEMHTAVNEMQLGIEDREREDIIDQGNLLYFAHEAAEEADYIKAKEFLLRRLHKDDSARHWLDYAVIALRFQDFPRAIECTKEALQRDPSHREGLLMYAVLMVWQSELASAVTFFEALVELYPLFRQGWISFYLFYKMIEKQESADICLVKGTKCLDDCKISVLVNSNTLTLSWVQLESDCENLFLDTAAFLLSLNLHKFAELCLSEEIERTRGSSTELEYYLAVSCHLQSRYEDSNCHLQNALIFERNDCNILWSLMGHNYYKLGNTEEACKMYKYSEESSKSDDQLLCYRAGKCFLDLKNYEEARDMFSRSISCHSTPLGWLGLGIAYFKMKDLDIAEKVLAEANQLDNRQLLIWVYLALVNLYKNKTDQFEQCLYEAKMYGTLDEVLEEEIERSKEEICNLR